MKMKVGYMDHLNIYRAHDKETVRINVTIPKWVHKDLEGIARNHGLSVAAAVRFYLMKGIYLNQEGDEDE